jgi:aryl-alcohol dehydrogenase-like predicted oxidoreductase
MTTRRAALRNLALLAGAALLPGRMPGRATAAGADKLGPTLPRRPLGRTGLEVSLLAVGGSHVGRPAEAEAERIIEAGIRTFETAQLYQGGGSEERYGKFLTPKYRAHVQIFTKTMATDGRTAREHLEGSLRRMKTDHLDLWQMHDINSPEDVDDRLRNGVLDTMLKAKSEGKVRHIGFTGHAT